MKFNLKLTLAIAATLAAPAAQTDAAHGVDTSEWKCESCPFPTAYESEADVGALYVDEDSAKFGEYNGLDDKGGYPALGASGGKRNASGTYFNYAVSDLGFDPEARLAAGKEGRFEARLAYDELPRNAWDSTVTPYSHSGQDALVLPSGWARAGSTAGMTSLAGSLAPQRIGTERTALGAGLDYLFGDSLKFFADFRREESEGSRLGGANFIMQALQFAEPVDATHDQFKVGAVYRFKYGFARLSWYGSEYDNKLGSVTFDNPYLPQATDTTLGRKALAPDNQAQKLSLDGNFRLPWWDGVLNYRFAQGTMEQDDLLLPLSTSTDLALSLPLPRARLNGDVDTTHYRASLSLRPHSRLRGRVGYRFDERDDNTAPFALAGYVESDSAIAPAASSIRYGYERTRLDAYGEVRVLDWLYLSGGAEQDEMKRSNLVTYKTEETRSWGRLRVRPHATVEVTGTYGEAHVDADGGEYTVQAFIPPENPLLRKFYLTNRDRDFADGMLTWTPWRLSFALQGSYANDEYRLSELGLKSSRDYRYAGTASWAVSEKISVYATVGYQNIVTEQEGQEGLPASVLPWRATHEDEFETAGGGIQWRDIGGKLDLGLDYTYAGSRGSIDTEAAAPDVAGAFPVLRSRLNALRLTAGYDVNERLSVRVSFAREDYSSSDWALQGIEAATLRNLLSMSADPYDYTVNVIGLSFRYRFGGGAEQGEE